MHMGLFDIFKKKNIPQASDNLNLEQLLQKAAKEPAFRAAFCNRLLIDDLVVITQNNGLPPGTSTLQTDTSVNLLTYPDGKIPVFTSPERIFDKGVIKEQVQYLQMKGRDLFSFTKGATFILNPYSDYGKELLPDEIESLLNGTLIEASRTLTIEKETKVLLAQPAKYPTEIVHALKTLFAERPIVKAAYLGWIHNPTTADPPHYIFAIDADGDIQSLTQEAGYTARHYLGANEIVDFIRIDHNGGLSDYFLKDTTPFYKK